MALAAAVLTDLHWLRQITSFQDGLPGLVRSFQARGRSYEDATPAHTTPRAGLVSAAIVAQDLRVLDALDRLAAQPHYARDIRFFGAQALAAGQGRLRALQWLHARRPANASFSEPATSLLDAVLNGSGDVATAMWLLEHCPEVSQTISPAALATAAANGHLGIIKWAHNATRFESAFQPSAMDRAAASGHIDILAFLHENRREGCTSRAPVQAARHGHLDVLRLLFEWYPHLFTAATTDILDAAAASTAPTRLAMAQFLHETTQTRCTVAAVDNAATRGDLDAVAYLLTHRREGFSCQALVSAARAGDVEMLRLLLQHRERENASTVDLTRAITAAAGQPGQLAAVRLLLDHMKAKPHRNVSSAIRVAAAWGHVEIVRLLVAEGEWISLLDAVSQASYQGHHEIVALLKQATQARHAQTAPAPPAF